MANRKPIKPRKASRPRRRESTLVRLGSEEKGLLDWIRGDEPLARFLRRVALEFTRHARDVHHVLERVIEINQAELQETTDKLKRTQLELVIAGVRREQEFRLGLARRGIVAWMRPAVQQGIIDFSPEDDVVIDAQNERFHCDVLQQNPELAPEVDPQTLLDGQIERVGAEEFLQQALDAVQRAKRKETNS